MARLRTPTSFERLTQRLAKLPGIGRRSAERIAFHLLRAPDEEVLGLAEALREFQGQLKVCSITGIVSESDPSPIATDPDRDHATILVVENPTDVMTIEQTGTYHGSYHVLLGRVSPLEGVGPGDLNVQRLMERVNAGGIREVILGLSPTLEGDGTALLLTEELQKLGVKVTRLARGLPAGASLGVVSKAVLTDAIHGRQGVR